MWVTLVQQSLLDMSDKTTIEALTNMYDHRNTRLTEILVEAIILGALFLYTFTILALNA